MIRQIAESSYPLDFRKDLATRLGNYLKNRQSVQIIGAKRVGISNFLRFFLNNQSIKNKYLKEGDKYLFIPIDLYDLVEVEIYPFWILTLKRIVDSSGDGGLEHLFLDAIQSKNLFLAIDSVRKSLRQLVQKGFLPTLFYIRFDRMQQKATKDFIYNLEGLKYATFNKLSYVFTTHRRLDQLNPRVFDLSVSSLAPNLVYIKPAFLDDLKIIAKSFIKKSSLKQSKNIYAYLFELMGGYVQYMQIALIILNECGKIKTKEELFKKLTTDERIILQSEEIWASLKDLEKEVLIKLIKQKNISSEERLSAKYLWDTGIIIEGKAVKIFSPIFNHFLKERSIKKEEFEFTKQELFLFNYLKSRLEEVCEREAIIEAVWPEEKMLGISDWAIDRLTGRLRNKLKQQKANYKIVTIKTRGYKLVTT